MNSWFGEANANNAVNKVPHFIGATTPRFFAPFFTRSTWGNDKVMTDLLIYSTSFKTKVLTTDTLHQTSWKHKRVNRPLLFTGQNRWLVWEFTPINLKFQICSCICLVNSFCWHMSCDNVLIKTASRTSRWLLFLARAITIYIYIYIYILWQARRERLF